MAIPIGINLPYQILLQIIVPSCPCCEPFASSPWPYSHFPCVTPTLNCSRQHFASPSFTAVVLTPTPSDIVIITANPYHLGPFVRRTFTAIKTTDSNSRSFPSSTIRTVEAHHTSTTTMPAFDFDVVG